MPSFGGKGFDMGKAKSKVSVAALHTISEPQELLSGLFNACTLGFAICDQQLRFRAVNNALGAMNDVSPEAHIGRTIHDVLGNAAVALEAPFRQVFFSGREVSNLEICAKLPKRSEMGYWIENYFPIRDAAGRVQHVAAFVVEITKQKRIQESIRNLTESLIRNLTQSASNTDTLLQQVIDGSVVPISSPEAKRTGSSPAATGGGVPLTAREREVVKFLAEGYGNKETAALLSISVKTVEAHRTRSMLKLNLHSTKELVRYAINHKLLDRSETTGKD